MIGTRKERGRVCTILTQVIRISPTPCDNSWQQFWTEKILSLSRDSNLACPGRIPSLYHFCFHRCQPCNCNHNSRIYSIKTIKTARAPGSVNRRSKKLRLTAETDVAVSSQNVDDDDATSTTPPTADDFKPFRRLSFPRDSGCFASNENLHRSSPAASDRSFHSGSQTESGIHLPQEDEVQEWNFCLEG